MTGNEALLLIRELGLSQREAAEAIGFSQFTISRYIRGRMPIPPVVALALIGLRSQRGETGEAA